MFKFTPIDMTDLVAILALGIGFILSILYNMNELAMSIATGFFGYIGGVVNGNAKAQEKMKTTEDNSSPTPPPTVQPPTEKNIEQKPTRKYDQ